MQNKKQPADPVALPAEYEAILIDGMSKRIAALERDLARVREEQQNCREALHNLTSATADLQLGHEIGDERAVIRNVLVGIKALKAERDAAVADANERWAEAISQHADMQTVMAIMKELAAIDAARKEQP